MLSLKIDGEEFVVKVWVVTVLRKGTSCGEGYL